MRYLVIIEKGPSGYGAYVPDLPGCIAAGESEAGVRVLIREAIELHIERLRENGEPVPEPRDLRGSVLHYDDPFEPVGLEDWEALHRSSST